MIALYILLGIIALILLILLIPVHFRASYVGSLKADVSYAFLKFKLYPTAPKQKKKKPEAPKEEKPKTEEKQEKPKEENILQKFYRNQGVEGVIQLVRDAANSVKRLLHTIVIRHLIIHDLYLRMDICGRHAAECAEKYGLACGMVFPPLSYICSTCHVRKYDVSVQPDYLATFSSAEFYINLSIRPLALIGAVIAFAFRLLFKVVLKLVRSQPKQADQPDIKDINPAVSNSQTNQGGALS